MELQTDILETLKCSKCERYLSYGPILLLTNEQNICARCPIDNGNLCSTRNVMYEKLASTMMFPCQYYEQGCKETLAWNRMRDHEESCDYREYDCPLLPLQSCKWKGDRFLLQEHYWKNHKEYFVDYKCQDFLYFEECYEKNMLMTVFGLLFLFQVKYNAITGKLQNCIRHLGPMEITSHLEFCVNIVKNDFELKTMKKVVSAGNFLIEEETSIESDIISLRSLLAGMENTKLHVTILKTSTSCLRCDRALEELNYYNEFVFYCAICSKYDPNLKRKLHNKLISCLNSKKKCPYKDFQANITKHEIWFCKYQFSNCVFCDRSIDLQSNMDHLKSEHCTHKNDNEAIYNNSSEQTIEECVIIVSCVLFFCKWKYDGIKFYIGVVSDLPKDQIVHYNCWVTLTNPYTDFKLMKKLDEDYTPFPGYDWSAEVSDDKKEIVSPRINWNIFKGSDKCYQIKININKEYGVQ